MTLSLFTEQSVRYFPFFPRAVHTFLMHLPPDTHVFVPHLTMCAAHSFYRKYNFNTQQQKFTSCKVIEFFSFFLHRVCVLWTAFAFNLFPLPKRPHCLACLQSFGRQSLYYLSKAYAFAHKLFVFSLAFLTCACTLCNFRVFAFMSFECAMNVRHFCLPEKSYRLFSLQCLLWIFIYDGNTISSVVEITFSPEKRNSVEAGALFAASKIHFDGDENCICTQGFSFDK